jgi:hypothetical protein
MAQKTPVDIPQFFRNRNDLFVSETFLRLLPCIKEADPIVSSFAFESDIILHPKYDHQVIEEFLRKNNREIRQHVFTLPMIAVIISFAKEKGEALLTTGNMNLFYVECKNNDLLALTLFRYPQTPHFGVTLWEIGEYGRWNWGTKIFHTVPVWDVTSD